LVGHQTKAPTLAIDPANEKFIHARSRLINGFPGQEKGEASIKVTLHA
jgi:hypothetical protein